MAKKKQIEKEIVYDTNMVETPVTQILDSNYMPYAMSVILARAIPDIRDGLKPAHRKLLYTMYDKGLLTKPRMKSATIAGAMMAYNPHGDAANYDTLVRLSKDNKTLLLPLIDNKGSMGKHYSRDRVCASSRYTEAKLMPVVSEFFKDLSKNGTDILDNYDGTLKEPHLLPVTFPHILCNPNLGIAVGMACNICSFNLAEVCNYTAAYIKNKKTDIHEYIKGPDFVTGATLLYNRTQMNTIYETGKGSFKMRSVYHVDEKKKIIIVTEIPFSTTIEAIVDDIVNLGIKGKLPEVKDVRDESDISGMKIAIDYKKGFDPDELMKKLFRLTSLEDSFSCNFNILCEGEPRVMGINAILNHWIRFRVETVTRTLQFDIDKLDKQLHLLYGLRKILLNIDEAIQIIRNTEREVDVVPNLIKAFDIDDIQADYIAEIKLRNINKEYILNKTKNVEELEKEKERLLTIIGSETRIKTLIANELKGIAKKYGQERCTKVLEVNEEELLASSNKSEEVVENYPVRLLVSAEGYIKKVRLPIRKESEIRLKENDFITIDEECQNTTELLVFTNKGNAHKVRLYEVDDCNLSDLGTYLPMQCELENEEDIISVVPTDDYSEFMTFVFANGKAAKVPLSSYQTKTKRKKLVNAFSLENKMVGIYHYKEDINIECVCDDERTLIFNTKLLPVKTTKNTIGVQVVRIPKNEVVLSAVLDTISKKQKEWVSEKIPCAPKKR